VDRLLGIDYAWRFTICGVLVVRGILGRVEGKLVISEPKTDRSPGALVD
jgi:hypothetical protein